MDEMDAVFRRLAFVTQGDSPVGKLVRIKNVNSPVDAEIHKVMGTAEYMGSTVFVAIPITGDWPTYKHEGRPVNPDDIEFVYN